MLLSALNESARATLGAIGLDQVSSAGQIAIVVLVTGLILLWEMIRFSNWANRARSLRLLVAFIVPLAIVASLIVATRVQLVLFGTSGIGS